MKIIKNKIVYEREINNIDGLANSIVFPDSIEEIKTLVKLSKLDIIPRGAGVNFVGSCIPNNSVIVDMCKMNKILEIDNQRKMVYVESGIIYDELNQELARHGLELPVHPIFSGIRTIGGLMATNASGSRELKYGKIKNWIDMLEVVNGKGELITVSKSDVDDFAGMEGLTGIIVRARLRLTTKKQKTLSIFKSDSFDEILELTKRLKLEHEVSMVEMFNKELSVLLGLENKYHILIEFESNKGAMKDKFYEKFIKLRDKAYFILASKGYSVIENPKFFLDSLKDFIFILEENKIPYFGNLSSGTIYPCFNPKEKEKYILVLNKIKRLRGRVSHSFGIGLTKKEFLDKNEKEIIKRIKLRHDPYLKFNRDKLIDSLSIDKEIPEKKKEKEPKQGIQEEVLEEEKKPEKTQEGDELFEELKTPEEKLEEFIEEQKINDLLESKPLIKEKEKQEEPVKIIEKPKTNYKDELFKKIDQNIILERKEQLTEKEKENIRKIAGGWFGR